MATRVVPYDLGCEPSPSVPAETLLQDGWCTYLLFFAVSKEVDETGYLKDLGVAIVACPGCAMTKFGYPNDEGRPEHPLYRNGMADYSTSIMEVVNSAWAEEVSGQMVGSARRIWGGRGMSWESAEKQQLRHFVITLKEMTFECLSRELVIERFCGTYDEAFAFVLGQFHEN